MWKQTFMVESVDDEKEREERRKRVENEKIIPDIPSEREMQKHYSACCKLFAENKINAKNVWKLNCIDYVFSILDMNKNKQKYLQIGSTSLDVSTKIYGLRVDDIHSDGLKLANCMNNKYMQNTVDQEEDCESDRNKVKRRKSMKLQKNKCTIINNSESTLANVTKLQNNNFRTRSNAALSQIDNYMCVATNVNNSYTKYMFENKEMSWLNYDQLDATIGEDRKYPLRLEKFNRISLLATFARSQVNVFDPEDTDWERAEEGFEEDGMDHDAGPPLHQLDGDITNNIFEPQESIHHDSSMKEAEDIFHDFNTVNEYSYFSNDSRILNVWAGPSHWKLKTIKRRKISRYTGSEGQPKKKSRLEAEAQPLIFSYDDVNPNDFDRLYRTKNVKLNVELSRLLLPIKSMLDVNSKQMFLKPCFTYADCKKQVMACEHNETTEFLEHAFLDGSGDERHRSSNYSGSEFGSTSSLVYDGDGLINMPRMASTMNISYATKAKKINMKSLKDAIWKTIEDGTDLNNNGMEKVITFNDVYTSLPEQLDTNSKETLSAPLAFMALLCVANEQNLKLASIDITNFKIEKDEPPCICK